MVGIVFIQKHKFIIKNTKVWQLTAHLLKQVKLEDKHLKLKEEKEQELIPFFEIRVTLGKEWYSTEFQDKTNPAKDEEEDKNRYFFNLF